MGTLTLVSAVADATSYNLDTINGGAAPDDWALYATSLTPTQRRNGGGSTISAAFYGTNTFSTNTETRTPTWTNGTPTASGSSNANVFNSTFATGDGFTITLPADTSVRTAWLLIGPYSTAPDTIHVTLSDGSATAITDTTSLTGATGGFNPFLVKISYSANSAGQSCVIDLYAGAASPQTVVLQAVAVAVTATGIAFDATGNSGDVAAASSYSGSASWSGSNRILCVDVAMLGPGVTVTAMTYGGAACTYVGSRASVTSFGSVEQWRICSSDSSAPAAGSNTLAVTLSSSLEFTVAWTSYTSVHQTVPTEAFNSAQATNAGTATDASVAVTSIADNCWIHAACVANDTSITAGNTTRNNVSGTLGSGANEDNGSAKTPAGAVTMSYSGMGITTTWVIAGYAIRPLAASGLAGFANRAALLGVGF